jgi:hypothetical protein
VFGSLFASHLLAGRAARRALLPAATAYIGPLLFYLIWKWAHFGAIIPNPYYAKTGLGWAGLKVGLHYLATSAGTQVFPEIVFLLGLALVLLAPSSRTQDLAAPAFFLLVYTVFLALVGGDFKPHHRFLMHLLPLMIGAGAIGIANPLRSRRSSLPADSITGKMQRGVLALSPPLFLALLSLASWAQQAAAFSPRPSLGDPLGWHHRQSEWYGRPASWLARHAHPRKVIAAGDVGYIGYVSGADRILDTNGLLDPHLARLPGAAAFSTDPHYVLAAKPDYIVVMVHYFGSRQVVGHSAFDRFLLADPGGLKDYTLAVELPGWRSHEYSFSDGSTRESLVRFRIYRRE